MPVKTNPEPPIEMKDHISYDPITGYFWWKIRGPGRRMNKRLGSIRTDGYRCISFTHNGKEGKYRAHQLAWWYYHGEWRPNEIDHVNSEDKDNNAISNLRLANQTQQNANTKLRKDNSSGYKGVSKHGKRWRAEIQINKKQTRLGVFDCPKEAHEAYKKAANEYFGEYAKFK